MTGRLISTVLALSMFVSAVACSDTSSKPTSGRTLKVGMTPWGAVGPLSVAEVKGYWKELGLDVQLLNFPDVQRMNGALRDKRTDISYEMVGTVVGLSADLKVRVLAETDWSHGGDKIVAKKGLNLTSLKGKNVGVYLNQPSVNFFLGKYLEENSVKLTDITLVEFATTNIGSEFTNGDFQLVVNYEPEVQKLLTPEANGEVKKTTADYPGVMPEGFWGRTDVLDQLPKGDVVKFLRGWVKAVKWAYDPANKQEYLDIFRSKTMKATPDAPDLPDADLQGLIDAVVVHDAKTQLARNAEPTGLKQYFVELKKFLTENQQPAADFDPETIFDNAAVVEALQAEQ